MLVCLTPLLCIEGNGRPLAVAIGGANTPDAQLLKATLEAIVVERPLPTEEEPQHLCLDKGYDNPTGEAAVAQFSYVPHIRRIGEEKFDEQREKTHPARRSRPPLGRGAYPGLAVSVPRHSGAL